MNKKEKRSSYLDPKMRIKAHLFHHMAGPTILHYLDTERGEDLHGGTAAFLGTKIVCGPPQARIELPIIDNLTGNPYGSPSYEVSLDALVRHRIERATGTGISRFVTRAFDHSLLSLMPFTSLRGVYAKIERGCVTWTTAGRVPALARYLGKENETGSASIDIKTPGITWVRAHMDTRQDFADPFIYIMGIVLGDEIAIVRRNDGRYEIRLPLGTLPQTVLSTLQNRPLAELISHPALDGFNLIVTFAAIGKRWIKIFVKDETGEHLKKRYLLDPEHVVIHKQEEIRIEPLRRYVADLTTQIFCWRHDASLPEPPDHVALRPEPAGDTVRPLLPVSNEDLEKMLHQKGETKVETDGIAIEVDLAFKWPEMVKNGGVPAEVLGDLTAADLGAHPALGIRTRALMMARALRGWDAEASRGARSYLASLGVPVPESDGMKQGIDQAVLGVMEMIAGERLRLR